MRLRSVSAVPTNRFRCLLVAIVPLLALVGCSRRIYEVEMQPRDGKLERKFTVYKETSGNNEVKEQPFEDDELTRLAGLYGVAAPKAEGAKRTFAGLFRGRLPNDLGGYGTFTRWESPFGTTTWYAERVRGNDDFAGNLSERRKAVDRLVELLIGWSKRNYQNAEELPRLVAFLDGPLRRDLVNLSIYMKAFELLPKDTLGKATDAEQQRTDPLSTHAARVAQFLLERDYWNTDQLPEWVQAVEEATQGQPRPLIALTQRLMATKIGIAADQPIPAAFLGFDNIDGLATSFREYLRDTDEFRENEAEWRKNANEEELAKGGPDPLVVLGELLVKIAIGEDSNLFSGGDHFTTQLSLPVAPFRTNGRWNAQESRIEWSARLTSDKPSAPLPEMLYAIWVEPTTEAQIARLGKVVLRDEKLLGYCIWYRGLSPERAKQWNAFVATWKPSEELGERILAFRFKGETDETDGIRLSREIRQMLATGLE